MSLLDLLYTLQDRVIEFNGYTYAVSNANVVRSDSFGNHSLLRIDNPVDRIELSGLVRETTGQTPID